MKPTSLRDLSFTADVGLQFAAAPGVTVQPAPPSAIGFTQPVAIYDRMRALWANALRLEQDMHYVADPSFAAAWRGWLANYKPLYDTYAGPNASNAAKTAVLFRTDDFSAEIAQREMEFQGWVADYNRQQQVNGQGVPQITPARPPDDSSKGWGLPWWLWVGAGVGVAGVGYLIYRKVQEGKAKARIVHKHAPALLEKYLPGFGKDAYEYSQAGRDARDVSKRDYPRPAPAGTLTLDDYASRASRDSKDSMVRDVTERYRGNGRSYRDHDSESDYSEGDADW